MIRWMLRTVLSLLLCVAYVMSLYYPPLASVQPWKWWGEFSLRLVELAGRLTAHGWGSSATPLWQYAAAVALIYSMPVALLALVSYGLLGLVIRGRRSHVTETRCRACGYILRGISEPRCPECGERI